jgi:hypothetical protein
VIERPEVEDVVAGQWPMARPGVRRTLRSVSNNVNKRASILRFYRAALSVFDNAAGRAARGKTAPRGRGRGRGRWTRPSRRD